VLKDNALIISSDFILIVYLNLMKFSFDVAFGNVMKLQDFNMKMLKDMLEKSKDVQADTVQAVSDFIESAREGRDEYKKMGRVEK
jgi:hypothetical protein